MVMHEWNEFSTLELIAAVHGLENGWGRRWDTGEEKWQQVADELPHLRSYLGFHVEEISEICKARFAFAAQCFNDLFTKYKRHPCLTNKVMEALADYSLTLNTAYQFPPDCSIYQVQPIPSPYEPRYEHYVQRHEEPAHTRSPSPVSEYAVASPRKSAAADERRGKGIANASDYVENPHHRDRVSAATADERRGMGIPNTYDCDKKPHHRDRVSSAAAADERRGKGIANTHGYDEKLHHGDRVSVAANEPGNERRRRHEPGYYEEVEEKDMKKGPNDDELLNEDRARVSVHGRTRDFVQRPTSGSSNFEEREIHPKREREKEADPFAFTVKVSAFHTTGSLLYIPAYFCNLYMPKERVNLTCIWKGKEHSVRYLPNKRTLSAGWKNFARESGFRKGDMLVFRRRDSLTYEVFLEED